jgi:hypothetical protein
MEVLNISKDDVDDEVPDVESTEDSDRMLGIAKHNEGLVILVNLMNVLGKTNIQDYASYATEAGDVTPLAA